MPRHDLNQILKDIAEVGTRLRRSEVEVLVAELEELKRRLSSSPSRRIVEKNGKSSRTTDTAKIEMALAQLQQFEVREQGFSLLENLGFNRRELELLARQGSVHITKDDNMSKIKEKLVESLIGSRLNSIAIRGAGRRY